MKAKFVNRINALLGALAVILAGCATRGQVTNNMPICMYGIPSEVQERNRAIEDSIRTEEERKARLQQDTLRVDTLPAYQRPKMKYGPRPV